MYPQPIATHIHCLLMDDGLLKFYGEATSLRGSTHFLTHLICHWDHGC